MVVSSRRRGRRHPHVSNAAGIIPVVEALLLGRGARDYVLAFMMSVMFSALSLPR